MHDGNCSHLRSRDTGRERGGVEKRTTNPGEPGAPAVGAVGPRGCAGDERSEPGIGACPRAAMDLFGDLRRMNKRQVAAGRGGGSEAAVPGLTASRGVGMPPGPGAAGA